MSWAWPKFGEYRAKPSLHFVIIFWCKLYFSDNYLFGVKYVQLLYVTLSIWTIIIWLFKEWEKLKVIIIQPKKEREKSKLICEYWLIILPYCLLPIGPTNNSMVELLLVSFPIWKKRLSILFLCYAFNILNSEKLVFLRGGGE